MRGHARSSIVTIAIVDDDATILDAARMVLEERDRAVHTFVSGEEFVAVLDPVRPPDCLILDPHLPGMSGSDVVARISAENLRIPIIGWTARPDSGTTQAMLDAGVPTMLTKPVGSERLIREIEAALIVEPSSSYGA